MSLIEGIGDEVMVLAAFLVVATTLLAAWFSTHVGERPGPQVQVIQTTITHIRGGQQSSGSTTVAAGSSGIDEGGGGEDRTIDTSASDDTQESDAVRSTNRVESTEQSFDESISGAGAQSQTDSLSRTGDQTVHADDTDSSLKVQSDNISNEKKSKEQDGKTVEETNSRPEEESSSTSYVENQRTSDDQNVLRNRNTGQVYPTLPSYSSDGGTHEEEVASGGISAGASSVEDIGRTDGDDEETSHTAEGRICIRVKFSHEDERLIQTRPEETLGQFRRQNFVEEIEAGKLVRFIANGQFLSDDSQTLASLNLTNNSVLHCHVTQGETIRQAQHNAQDGDLDLGHFMVPLFGCILGFVWYLRWQYRYMFNATSTLSLIGVSVLFFLAVLAAWRG